MSAQSAPPPLLLLAVTAGAAVVVSALLLWRNRSRSRSRSRREWEPVGTLSAIHLYPLKSGAAVHCPRARVTSVGLRAGAALDRCLAVVCNETILCAMSRRRIVLITAECGEREVTLTAPDMPTLRVPLPVGADGGFTDADGAPVVRGEQFGTHNAGLDLGAAASRWLGEFFADGKQYTLMWFREGAVPARRTVDIPKPYARFAQPDDIAAFQNVTALSIICSSSLDELNSRLDTPVTLDHFRQNLVITGAPPFSDDDWALVRIGGAVLRRVKAVNRCGNTCVDPLTGERSAVMEPLRTLRTFRLATTKEERLMYKDAPLMGSALGVDVEGDVAVGDTVYAIRK